jgi:hypothetical protein
VGKGTGVIRQHCVVVRCRSRDGWIGVVLALPLMMFGVRRLSAGTNVPVIAALVLSSVLSIFTVAATSNTTNSIRISNTAGRLLGMPAVGSATVGIGLWLVFFGTRAALFGSVLPLTRHNG